MLTAMSISACTKINPGTEQSDSQYPYIFFDAEVLQTKAMLDTECLPDSAGTDFGVFGYRGDSESITTPVFENERMYRKTDNGSFLYDNLVLWTEDSYDFYAYYPYKSGTQIGMHEEKGAYVTYTQPTSLDDMIDFMTASNTGVTYALGSLVNLKFDHRLFAFDVELKNSTTSGSLTISSATVKLHDVASEATLYYDGDLEVNINETLDIEETFSFENKPEAEVTSLLTLNKDSFLLLPTSSLNISFTIKGTDAFGDFNISVGDDDNPQVISSEFEAGKRYKMVISKLDGEGFMATVSGWDKGEDITFTFN